MIPIRSAGRPFARMLLLLALPWLGLRSPSVEAAAGRTGVERPNLLWLTCEDTGPQLGCYGDRYASTPHLDALAARGLRYRRAWSTAPVCAPARTAIISGLYPSATGAEHMRSEVDLSAGRRLFPQFLRDAGYYCSNNQKEDYNLRMTGQVWDESSGRAHWRNRAPGQPFFAVFNFTETHESQIRRRPHAFSHDPARAPVPPFMPDTPEVREAWAQYHDQVSAVDARVGANLRELESAGLREDTIIFFFGDHGPGLPRHKRSACDSGLRVPLIVWFPPKWRHLAPADYREGAESGRLVGFVDLAPTVLSLAGIKPPAWMQGRAFAGPFETRPPSHAFGLRGRMDERPDLVRCVTDGRFVLVRNYLPHLPHGQRVAYLFETPATIAWYRLFQSGALNPIQRAYWEPREPEELYDLEADPFETVNLANSPAHRTTLARLRRALREHTLECGDLGLLPEAEMIRRAADRAPGDLLEASPRSLTRRWLAAAETSARRETADLPRLDRLARHRDGGVRYWAAQGYLVRGAEAVSAGRETLRRLVDDESPSVRVAAAQALATHGHPADRVVALDALMASADVRRNDYLVSVAALNALDPLVARLTPVQRERLAALPRRAPPEVSGRMNDYLQRLLDSLLADRHP